MIEMWECRFRQLTREDPQLQAFLAHKKSPTPQRKMNDKELLREVTTGRLFGMLEVDIRVPEIWSDHFNHPTMTPYQYFEEMSPLF